jgi:hypothetical protein
MSNNTDNAGKQELKESPYPLRYLQGKFKPETVKDIFGRMVECCPKFVQVSLIKPKNATETLTVNGTKFRYRKEGYMPQTKDYHISYQIL